MNSAALIGRLTRDVENSMTTGGTAVAKFSIAVNRREKKGDEWVDGASFFDCEYFGRGAEAVRQYLLKGKQVGVRGHLVQDRWQDKTTGNNRSKIKIVVEDLTLLGGGAEASRPDAPARPTREFNDDVPF